MAILELVKGSAAGTRFELDGDRAVIGRSADCEVPLDVPAVSRRHAAIVRERGKYFIEDLQSRNGTMLNDARVTERAPLGEGDRLVICDQEFRFYTGHGTGLLDPMRNLVSGRPVNSTVSPIARARPMSSVCIERTAPWPPTRR